MPTTQPIPTGYKPSPLGPIPQDWEVSNLKTISSLITKGTTPNNFTENGIKFIKTESFLDDKIDPTKCLFIDSSIHNGYLSRSILEEGDILFAIAGSIGKCVIVPKEIIPANTNQALAIIRLKNKNQIFYISQLLKSVFIKKYIYLNVSVGAQPNLSLDQINKFNFPLPPLPEQTAIATILSTVDTTIQQTQEIIRNLALRNKGLQQNLLFKQEDKNRKKIKLDSCLIYTPRPVEKPSGNFFALGVRSHGKGIFHKNDFDPEDIAMDVLYEVKENDLVVNITFAREQAIAIAGKQDEGGLVSHRFPTYTFKSNKAIPEYFRYLIIQKKFKYMLDLISPGGAGRNRVLSKKDFLKLEVVIPSVEEQEKIANILNKATQQLNQHKQKLTKLQTLKKGLMQQLLTGKVRVKIK